MEQLKLWERFKRTGKIQDYLNYVQSKKQSQIYKERCLESQAR